MAVFDKANMGGRMRAIVQHFDSIEVNGSLKTDLEPRQVKPILSGIEIVAPER